MMRRALHALTGRLRVTIIKAEVSPEDETQTPLFERYLVCRLPGGGAVYLHHYLRADPDRGLHDHPWHWAVAVPLVGGYYEDRAERMGPIGPITARHRRGPGRAYMLDGHDFHKIAETIDGTSWSLFIHGGGRKAWGFLRVLEGAQETHLYYPHTSGDGDWLNTAPRGRDVERASA